VYTRHEANKKREYAQRILEIQHGVFTPHVLSASDGMAREATVFYKQLVERLNARREEHYSLVMGRLRCGLSFALLRCTIMCIRGSRSSKGHPVQVDDLALAVSEGGLLLDYYFFNMYL